MQYRQIRLRASLRAIFGICLANGFIAIATAAPSPADRLPWESLAIDTSGLPPRSTPTTSSDQPPPPAWVRDHLRMGHLPGYDERMVKEFLKAGYTSISINALAHWDRVGPSAKVGSPGTELEFAL